jgi:hypothetical protein
MPRRLQMPGPKPPTTSSSRSSTDLPLTYRWLLHPELASSHPVRTTSGAKTQANLGIFVNEQAPYSDSYLRYNGLLNTDFRHLTDKRELMVTATAVPITSPSVTYQNSGST